MPVSLDTEKCSNDAIGALCNSGCCMIYTGLDICLIDELRGVCDFTMSIGLIIGIVIGVVALGGIVGYIIYRKRKSSLNNQNQDSSQGVYTRA